MDGGPALLLYDAVVDVAGNGRDRKIPISRWFLEPRSTALEPTELVKGIELCKPDKRHAGCYLKMGRYKGQDLAQVGVGAMILEGFEYRIAFGAVSPVPARVGGPILTHPPAQPRGGATF